MISQWTVVSVFNKIFNFFVSHLFVIYFLSFQLFVFSALWSSQPFELPSFLVSKLFGPPKMSLVLRPPVAWSLILRTGGWRSFSSVTMLRKVRSLTYNLNHVKCVLPRIGQCCIHGIPWFSIEHVQADVSWSNRPRLEWWSPWGREMSFSSRRYRDHC